MKANENTPMPIGKYKFIALKRVPANVLLNFAKPAQGKGELKRYPEIYEWIRENHHRLKEAGTAPLSSEPVEPVCRKIGFPSQGDAKAELRRITESPGTHTKPIRTYECRCGFWHLTSKPHYKFQDGERNMT